MTPDLTALTALETSLWQTATRFDPDWIEQHFAKDFREFGRSGRRYDRAQMINAPEDQRKINATLHLLEAAALSEDIALVTYVSEVRYPTGTEWGNRTSIWDRASGQWQLRFHQGTPTEPLN